MENRPCHIYLIESSAELQARIQALLADRDEYRLWIFDYSADALAALETSRDGDISLIISSYRMPRMKGDEVLKKARELSGRSQRILISDLSDIDTMINAINTADIHSCLVLPFADGDFLQQVDRACYRYREVKKQEHLERLTRRQNKQMFMMASDLKKVNEKEMLDIANRKAVIKKLEACLADLPAPGGGWTEYDGLESYIEQNAVENTPDGFSAGFEMLENGLNALFNGILSEALPKKESRAPEDIPGSGPADEASIGPDMLNTASELLWPIVTLADRASLFGQPVEKSCSADQEQGGTDYITLTMSENQIKAFITIKQVYPDGLTLEYIKSVLADNHVIAGLKPDEEIEAWLSSASVNSPPFAVAAGKPPVPSENAQIRYHFPKDYRSAGKLKPDGTIDFTDRGKIPYVKKDTCLAVKILPVEGTAGITVCGDEIPVSEPVDLAFEAGSGARMDDAGTRIFADADGQPHLDALGVISVLNELEINGDVCFETGNIDFKGNLIVKGSIRQGFTVKAASLICQQIEGASVILTGDLNCSNGIIDAQLIKVRGNIQATYINNSIIESFGDLMVHKEIIDSRIQISGKLLIPSGVVLSSRICAKGGIEAGAVGTDVSTPSELTVGVDAYIDSLTEKIHARINENKESIAGLEKEIDNLNRENHDLNQKITEYAHVQDRAQLALNAFLAGETADQGAGDKKGALRSGRSAAELERAIRKAEENIERGFERQAAIEQQITAKKNHIKKNQQAIDTLEKEAALFRELSAKKKALAELTVKKQIYPGTRIEGPHSKMIIHNTESRCKILEIKRSIDDIQVHEMVVVNDV